MSEQHVLMVGGSVETEAVLRTVFRTRGVGFHRDRHGDMHEHTRPTVVLVQGGTTERVWPDVPRVMIGPAAVADEPAPTLFDYPDLVAAIDRVLREAAQATASEITPGEVCS